LALLDGRTIAVIGYGNQGRSQALNLRDSGLQVLVGNREDEYAERARAEGMTTVPIAQAVQKGQVVMLLIPDEVMPALYEAEIAPYLSQGDVLVFASGYAVTYGEIELPPNVDVILVAPRMIGAGVRDLYVAGRGFPSFVGVEQDRSGRAFEIALALAKGIGSTRAGVVQVSFAQEAELDLFTEQCFGPAFGHVLTTAVDLLIEQGYPPEAVLLELYMSGEFSYTLSKIAELGIVEQTRLHSNTSQYGSMSRGMRFMLPELRVKMREGLGEIRSGQFAREWAAEQAAGCPTLHDLRLAAQSLPLAQMERELRDALGGNGAPAVRPKAERTTLESKASRPRRRGLWSRLRGKGRPGASRTQTDPPTKGLAPGQVEPVLRAFVASAPGDPALRAFGQDKALTTHYVLRDPQVEFYLRFAPSGVTAALGAPPDPAEVRIQTEAAVLDGMLTGHINAMRAAMSGKLVFSGEARLAMGVQRIQGDLCRLYSEARDTVMDEPHQ
jgi:ketol-acid reductoisomerase